MGTQRGVATICIGADDDVEQRRREIRQRIEDVDAGDGVVIITDMFGGTPSNLAISMMDRPGVEVIAGANLPMLVKLAKVRGRQTLTEVGRMCRRRRAQIHRVGLVRAVQRLDAQPVHARSAPEQRPSSRAGAGGGAGAGAGQATRCKHRPDQGGPQRGPPA